MNGPRVLFIPTSSSAIMFWRIQNFVEAAWRLGAASFQNPLWVKNLNDIQPWQGKISDGPKYDPIFIRAFVPMIESGCVNADAVVFQYAHEEGALELFESIKIKFPNLPILTEIDDNILSIPPWNESFMTYDPRADVRRRALIQIKSSDGLIVSTPHLKEVYADHNPNIHVIENCIDFKMWDKLKKKSKPGIRIGWAGGTGHEGDFETVSESIKGVLSRHHDVKLVLINGPSKFGVPEFLKGIKNVEHHARWETVLHYPKMLAEMDIDIGIAPLVDCAFNRGKSNLKWLENSALGIPTVAMKVGHMEQTIDRGVDGLLAEDDVDFAEALELLIKDKKRRKAIGSAANARVRRDFNVDKIVKKYIGCLEDAISKKAEGLHAEEVAALPEAHA